MRFLLILLLITTVNTGTYAQAFLKTEYIGSSSYEDIDNNKTGGKGDAKVISGGIQIPFYVKMNENNRPTTWGLAIGGSYTSFNNKNIPANLCPSEILNAQISLLHMRPVSKNWSLLASLGAGSYTAHADISRIKMKNVLAHGGAIFIWHLKDNLDIGGGLAVNNSFGYPMAFPSLYLDWRLGGRYEVKVSMMNAVEISAGMRVHENIKLGIIGEMNGSMALEEVNGEDMMFTHQYMVAGFRPEFTLGKSFSLSLTAGVSAIRPAYYTKRTLKSFFKVMDREHDPEFKVAPYVSLALAYKF
jgi:hypothetical protein